MFGINKNKIKLSNIGMSGFEIELLFDGLNAKEQKFITRSIIGYVEIGYFIPLAIQNAQTDLILKKYLTR